MSLLYWSISASLAAVSFSRASSCCRSFMHTPFFSVTPTFRVDTVDTIKTARHSQTTTLKYPHACLGHFQQSSGDTTEIFLIFLFCGGHSIVFASVQYLQGELFRVMFLSFSASLFCSGVSWDNFLWNTWPQRNVFEEMRLCLMISKHINLYVRLYSDIMDVQSETHLELFLQVVHVLLAHLYPMIGQIQFCLLVLLLVLNVSQSIRDLTMLITLRWRESGIP